MNIQKQIEQLEKAVEKFTKHLSRGLDDELEQLNKCLDKIKQQASKPKQMIEKAERGSKYYFIDGELLVRSGIDGGYCTDDNRYNAGNYYLDKQFAERVAKYYRNNNMFIRKALEFADGYEWTKGNDNHCVGVGCGAYEITCFYDSYCPTEIYMSAQNAERFKAWLEDNMPLQ